ncbi:lysylphosphatidylglycerol synthase domain-containing protein [Actinotignum sanguinis]|uniref:Lysylphosphatidylglycerol synthase domain-containing protein n=1 Tax=Actinotignum sanguinis TaxID=1445614 RepID=A0ABT5V5D1_9ACTO|nr:lysylphosphatidylglycerol synthase domain-containing protein [Actinotignum sanguinis]MDE1656031.1 lysylphosphatidylglycerol synthase domain-containing protein [Actinotignum sanguinis]
MKKILSVLQAPPVRAGFMILAVIAAIWAIVANREAVGEALAALPWWVSLAGIALSLLYVACTMVSWRYLLNDVGQPVPARVARRIFYSSQVAKYLPGGVWNFVAAAEMGAAHSIARRRSFVALLVSMVVSIVTGLVLAVLALLLGPAGLMADYGWLALAIPVGVVALMPPVLNKIISLGLKILRRGQLEAQLSWRGTGLAALWAAAGWLLMGAQLWLMLIYQGMAASIPTFLLATGGYALGWTVGFLVFFVPAGVGVRELALAAVLSTAVGSGPVVVVVLLSRVFTTLADVSLGLLAGFAARRAARR